MRKWYKTKDGKKLNARNVSLPAGKVEIDVEYCEGLIRLLFLVDGFLVRQICVLDAAEAPKNRTHDMREVFQLLRTAINSAVEG